MRIFFLEPRGVRTDAEPSAEMVEDDRRLGKLIGQRGDVAELRVEQPGVEAEAAARQFGEPAAEIRIAQQSFGRVERHDLGELAADPGRDLADAAEAPAGGFVAGVKDLRDKHRIEPEIGPADDASHTRTPP